MRVLLVDMTMGSLYMCPLIPLILVCDQISRLAPIHRVLSQPPLAGVLLFVAEVCPSRGPSQTSRLGIDSSSSPPRRLCCACNSVLPLLSSRLYSP